MQNSWNYQSHYRLSDHLFGPVLIAMMTIAVGLGLFMGTIKQSAVVARTVQSVCRAKMIIAAPKPQERQAPKVRQVEPKPLNSEPVDLTEKKEMAQTEETQQPPTATPVRKVYGLRKVYARGLGSGGTMSDAVVGKLGNTLNKEFDTLSATESDVKGTVVSTTTVTTPPRFRKQVKPEYTTDMLKNRVEGVVKVKALVDIDGKVKKAAILSDIGYDSATQAFKATLSMEFDPALRGLDPVAVWIIIPIRFVLLS